MQKYVQEYVDEQTGIYIRLMTKEDTDQVVCWRNSEEVRKHFIYQGPFTREIHEEWIRTKVKTGKVVQMMICDIHTDLACGSVYVRDIDTQNHKAEYGIFIGETKDRGRGVGTAAARLMLRYCFEKLHLHRVYLRALADNVRAIRSYEKAGFVREGLMREDVCIGGRYMDIVWMGVVCPGEENA